MSEHPLVEIVARAMFDATEKGESPEIAAIRAALTFEPTPAMKMAGSITKNAHRITRSNFRAGVPDIYTAMTAALLKEVEDGK